MFVTHRIQPYSVFQHRVSRLPFLRNARTNRTEQQILNAIVMRLRSQIYMPEEIVIAEGDYGQEMYFISKSPFSSNEIGRFRRVVGQSTASF